MSFRRQNVTLKCENFQLTQKLIFKKKNQYFVILTLLRGISMLTLKFVYRNIEAILQLFCP